MQSLVPCVHCHRHVLSAAESCPFCFAARVAHADTTPHHVPLRTTRAALFALAAATAVAVTACHDDKPAISPAPEKPAPAADAGLVTDPGSPVALYGVPAPPNDPPPVVPAADAGLTTDPGGAHPMYGMPPPHHK